MLKLLNFSVTIILFNVIRNLALAKVHDTIRRYDVGYKPPSYHDVRENLLKQSVQKTYLILEEYR